MTPQGVTLKFFPLKLSDVPVSFHLLSGRILLGLGQLVMVKVLTSVLDPAEIGKYYLLMSVISWFSLLFINPVTVYISRHLHGWDNKGVGRAAIKKLILFLAVVSLGASAILFCFNSFGFSDFKVPDKLLYFVIPLLIGVSTLAGLFPALCNILGRYRAFIIFSNLELWGKIGFICLSILLFPHLVGTILGAILFWGVILALVSGNYFYRNLKKPHDDERPFNLIMAKDILRFSWPLAVAACLYWAQSEGYRFILQDTAGVDIMGKFVVAYSLGAAFIIAVDTLFHQLYLPVYYKEIAEETDESHIAAWNKYAKKVMGVCIPVGIYIACAGPFLTRWLVHARYQDMGVYVVFGAISQLFRILSAASYFGIVARKNTNILILPNLIGSIIALVGTWFISSKSPIIGTGIFLILSHLITSIGSHFQLKKELAVQIPWGHIKDAVLLSLPPCFILLIAYKLGWTIIPIYNLSILFVTGLGMLYIQWRLSKDVWFQR